MLRIAIQAKGRLNEQSIDLLSEAGIGVAESKRKLISRADGFPMEVLYLRDDDIPQAVAMGVADLGIVGLNEVAEKNFPVERTMDLGFGSCRISLAVDRTADYNGLDYFRGKRVATSYPNILARFFAEKGIDAEIHTIGRNRPRRGNVRRDIRHRIVGRHADLERIGRSGEGILFRSGADCKSGTR